LRHRISRSGRLLGAQAPLARQGGRATRLPPEDSSGFGGMRRAFPPYGIRPLAPFGLAADRRDRDMAHRRVGLGAVPMPLASLDVHDVADVDLKLPLRAPMPDPES